METQREEHHTAPATATAANWSEEVEDLVSAGEVSSAIAFLESLVSRLESRPQQEEEDPSSANLQLASALAELARLYSSQGFSLKSDQLLARSSALKERGRRGSPSRDAEIAAEDLKDDRGASPSAALTCIDSLGSSAEGHVQHPTIAPDDEAACDATSEDDWEAMADRSPNELLPAESLPEVSKLSLEDGKNTKAPKRRGRGTFTYKKDELYSDRVSNDLTIDEVDDEGQSHNSEEKPILRPSKYGTSHVLVLAGFPPSTRTTELEKLLEAFRNQGVVIRWVNDTTALAVFRTPVIALEALSSIQFPFTVRILEEEDSLLSSIPAMDLEPPKPRPQTSARTAQRLIAQGMGLKLPLSSFGSTEFRKQEEARKDRIVRRHQLRDDAWGED
ncbi:coiled-coil domain-containing protein R3HCC1L [Eucalyptus grandis]|uniref:Uncharacterized protein n=2 Tax=Eucalyptus grandis TaxID=71139 RepID=A0ACC3LXS3_EUCGR|nr:coiled-coil domain-containing protein R3HCC1L [Eucalyptus grandis]KAK3443739.1 hypothetical protein EUGRSUZ_B03815 [Eucalyptus grandis]